MVVGKRTVLNENRERVHVRWTAKRGNEIDLIGQLNVAWLLVHPGGEHFGHFHTGTFRLDAQTQPCLKFFVTRKYYPV